LLPAELTGETEKRNKVKVTANLLKSGFVN
jgi:hypothetical protein